MYRAVYTVEYEASYEKHIQRIRISNCRALLLVYLYSWRGTKD